jgi:hypothetical protein
VIQEPRIVDATLGAWAAALFENPPVPVNANVKTTIPHTLTAFSRINYDFHLTAGGY